MGQVILCIFLMLKENYFDVIAISSCDNLNCFYYFYAQLYEKKERNLIL